MAVNSSQPTVYYVITFFLLSSYIDTVYTVQTVHMDDNDTFILRFYCRGIPRPDTWGHGYRIDDLDNDLVNDDGCGSGGVVATA